jgi:hypothetical protein
MKGLRMHAYAAGFWRRPSRVAALLLVLSAAGCGSGTVRGKVNYKGQPLGAGTVVFTVQGKGSVRSEISEDGGYAIYNCPTGTARITVETASGQATPIRDPRAPPAAGMKPPPGAIPEGVEASAYRGGSKKGNYTPIPVKYNDPDKSGLECQVHGGSQEYNIDLQ